MTSTTRPRTLPAGTWELDPTGTTVTVSAKHLGAFVVPAAMEVSSGTIDVGPEGNVIRVDAASYTSRNPKRNEHVRGSDFLDAVQHPAIELHADDVTPVAGGYTAAGTVTAKGRTAMVDIAVDGVDIGDGTGSFGASMRVDRGAIGVDKLPSFAIGRSLDVRVEARVRRTG